MPLSLVHFALCRLLGVLVPSGRRAADRDVELFVLRHQLKVLSRRKRLPPFNRGDRIRGELLKLGVARGAGGRSTPDVARKLAEVLGWKPAQVARLELGERTPSIDTLLHLSRRLGLRFAVSIGPVQQPPGVRPRKSDVVQEVSDGEGTRLIVAAG